ncbi:MAG: hypothetical protein WCK51_05765 [Armatimonadota bacterium]
MSSLTLLQPLELVPFSPVSPVRIPADAFALDKPVVLKLNELYMYGNLKLLASDRFTLPIPVLEEVTRQDTLEIHVPVAAEILKGRTLVTGVYSLLHDQAAVLPLRWGAPRILVLTSGFLESLGAKLDQELTPLSRRWWYEFDPLTDLVVSPFAPEDSGANSHKRIELVE